MWLIMCWRPVRIPPTTVVSGPCGISDGLFPDVMCCRSWAVRVHLMCVARSDDHNILAIPNEWRLGALLSIYQSIIFYKDSQRCATFFMLRSGRFVDVECLQPA